MAAVSQYTIGGTVTYTDVRVLHVADKMSQYTIGGTVTYTERTTRRRPCHDVSVHDWWTVTYTLSKEIWVAFLKSQYTACPASSGNWWYGHLYIIDSSSVEVVNVSVHSLSRLKRELVVRSLILRAESYSRIIKKVSVHSLPRGSTRGLVVRSLILIWFMAAMWSHESQYTIVGTVTYTEPDRWSAQRHRLSTRLLVRSLILANAENQCCGEESQYTIVGTVTYTSLKKRHDVQFQSQYTIGGTVTYTYFETLNTHHNGSQYTIVGTVTYTAVSVFFGWDICLSTQLASRQHAGIGGTVTYTTQSTSLKRCQKSQYTIGGTVTYTGAKIINMAFANVSVHSLPRLKRGLVVRSLILSIEIQPKG
jgi:hypothetical protein